MMHLDKLIRFKGRKGPVLLVIADGVGMAPAGPANAVSLANSPNMDTLLGSKHSTQLYAHGTHVGLPSDGDMGNSEVGHNTLGGGRIFDQGAKLVQNAFDEGSLFESDSWRQVIAKSQNGGTVHFLGLLSDGNVHSNISHLLLLLENCLETGVTSVRIHCLLDGRDVDPRSAVSYLQRLQARLDSINSAGKCVYKIASAGGRMSITMDRYEADWDMVERGYRLHVLGETGDFANRVSDAIREVERQYAANENLSDQYIHPFVVVDDQGPVGVMQDGDAVVLFNFRGDRAIEICQAFDQEEFAHFDRKERPDLFFCGMLEYDGDLKVPNNYLVNPPVIEDVMVEYLCAQNIKTFAISETQKFGHVTYFWNGNKSGYIDKNLETYIEVPSDTCEFNQAPNMKAKEITEATISLIEKGEFGFGRINFANGDMVGHTGDVVATVQSIECVDACLGELMHCIEQAQGILIFTADHGNADEMFVIKNGKSIPRTSHTLNLVPFVIYDPGYENEYKLKENFSAGLANVASTVFNLMGFQPPADYLPALIEMTDEPTRRVLYQGQVVNLGLETTQLSSQEMIALEVIRHPGGVVLIAINDKNQLCLTRQFRHAVGDWIWELPAGIIGSHEEPESAAIREIKEVINDTTVALVSLGAILTSPGFCDERLHFFLAENVQPEKNRSALGDFIEVHWLSINKIESLILKGKIEDAKTLIGLNKVKQIKAGFA